MVPDRVNCIHISSILLNPGSNDRDFFCQIILNLKIKFMETQCNNYQFATRMGQIPKSFIREILKITSHPDIISFAGGLPNPEYFPLEAIKEAAIKVFENDGKNVLQYAVSEGYQPLREFIADRYQKKSGMKISPTEILITNGAQQGLDLAGKLFINPSDYILLERPAYLGAIQSFSAYEPRIISTDLLDDGIDPDQFKDILKKYPVKLFYTVPNFQNPTGISYSEEKRHILAQLASNYSMIIVEDDPYGELRFNGKAACPFKKLLPDQTILLGSFSKIISPGMRMGWMAADKKIIEMSVLAKQACDLHSNFLSQRIIYQYLMDNDLDKHIDTIKNAYKKQKDFMLKLIQDYFPEDLTVTQPEGGMFLWVTLPPHINAFDLLDKAAKEKVAFVPGGTFYSDHRRDNCLRLNFSNTNFEDMEEGIKRLGKILKDHV
jgi:2-aminoadipate transaminase